MPAIAWLGARLTVRTVPAILLAGFGYILYAPFLGNPPVFDDILLHPERALSLVPRPRLVTELSFFLVHQVTNGWAAQRALNLALHIGCSLVLFATIRELLLRTAPGLPPTRAAWCALGAAALFAANPVAAYAVGYLVERSIVLAGLFSLASLLLFIRGLTSERGQHMLLAAACYWLAVLSKEHAVLAAPVALLAIPIAAHQRRVAVRRVVVYCAACLPALLAVCAMSTGVIGRPYEPEFDVVASQLDDAATFGAAPWLASAEVQCWLFLRYMAFWLWPDPSLMSIDLRVDLAALARIPWPLIGSGGLAVCVCMGTWLLRNAGLRALAGLGLLFWTLLFLVEFSAVRVQEPLVLYRSYLWAPGLAMVIAALLARAPTVTVWPIVIVALSILSMGTRDRLETLSSPLAVWQDAVAKLPSRPVAGGWRTLYNLAREHLEAGQPYAALQVADRCVLEYPNSARCRLVRGATYLQLTRYADAVRDLQSGLTLNPGDRLIEERLKIARDRLDEKKPEFGR